jgi:TRAP-type C4-dicarboxylate transport system substrate-binding protein
VRENFHRFQQLPPERRQMLRERWRNASPAQRQQMIEHAREMRQAHPSAHAPAGHGGPPPPHH